MTPSRAQQDLGRTTLARRALLALAVVLGTALVAASATAWWATAGVERAAEAGARDHVFHTLGRAGARLGSVAAAVPEVFAELEGAGVVYLAFVAPDGTRAEAGTPAAPLPERLEPGPPVRLPGSLRWVGPLGPPPPGGPIPPAGRGGLVVLDLEPHGAERLARTASWALGLALVGAVLLVASAILLDRVAGRARAAELAVEQGRQLVALGEMSAVLAHEIRNPLAALKGHAQLIQEAAPDDLREPAEHLVRSARRLQDLVEDLLSFARTGDLTTVPTDPVQLVQQAVEEAAPGATVHASGAPTLWVLDPGRIRQVLANALRNAQEASPGEVEVHVEGGAALTIEVRDRGPGWPDGPREAVFEAFHTTRTRGVGLGLAVARRLAALHGGAVEALDRPGGGAILRLVLPPGGAR